MAKMVPPRVSQKATRGEKIIYNNLKQAPHSSDWIVIHSKYIDNPANKVKPREIDFVILIPSLCVVICLEVKDVFYSRIKDGEWFRGRNDKPERRSPPEQAESAMWALKKEFEKEFFQRDSLISVGCAVGFTRWNSRKNQRLPRQLALLIESHDALNPEKLSGKLMEYAKSLQKANTRRLENNWEFELTQRKLHFLAKELNPNMKFSPSNELVFKAHLDTLRPQLLNLLEEQHEALSEMSEYDRVAVDGAAGTGKTVLAMEFARRLSESGKTVGLLCNNDVLSSRFGAWAKEISETTPGTVVAGTPVNLPEFAFRQDAEMLARHQHRLRESPELEESLKLRGAFPHLAWKTFVDLTLEDLDRKGVFDVLIVDEAQNLCDEEFLRLMDAMLKGGLTEGKWVMFGDFKNQNIVNFRTGRDGRSVLMELYGINFDNANLAMRLEQNCRNTHEIAAAISHWIKVPSLPISGVHGPLVQVKYFKTDDDLETTLDQTVGELQEGQLQSRQIVMLTSSNEDFDVTRQYGGWGLQNIREAEFQSTLEGAVSVSGDASSFLRYSDIYDFQGLESEVVVLVLPLTERQTLIGGTATMPDNDLLRKVLYTGMSRAKMGLIVVAHEGYKEHLDLEPRFAQSYSDRLEDLSLRTSAY